MDPRGLPFAAVKFALCTVLLATAVACGVKLDNQGDSADADGATAKNQLILLSDGAYSLDLSTSDAHCRRLVDDQMLELRYRQDSGADQGLEVSLRVAGDLDAGDALTVDNSNQDHFFDARLTTPAGQTYRYDSTAPSANATGSLTVLQASQYHTSGRLSLERVPPLTLSSNAATPTLSVRGSFTCSHWD